MSFRLRAERLARLAGAWPVVRARLTLGIHRTTLNTELEGLTLHRRGKVRDVYEIDDRLLIVATDRISAFDYVLGSGIPDKGKVLTQLSGSGSTAWAIWSRTT